MGFGPPKTALGHVKAGKLKMLAVTVANASSCCPPCRRSRSKASTWRLAWLVRAG
jgi:hypothetical protein